MFQASVEQEVQESNVWSTFSNLWSSSCKWFVKGRDPSEFHLPLENQEEFSNPIKMVILEIPEKVPNASSASIVIKDALNYAHWGKIPHSIRKFTCSKSNN